MSWLDKCPNMLIGQDWENTNEKITQQELKNLPAWEELARWSMSQQANDTVEVDASELIEWMRIIEERMEDLEQRIGKYDEWITDDHK